MTKIPTKLTMASFKAGFWLTVYRGFAKAAGFIKTIILARILTPAQFGIFGIVSIALNLVETFTDLGLEQALIQKKDVTSSLVTGAWVATLVRGLLVSLGLFLAAPLVGYFFQVDNIEWFVRIIAITPLLRAFRNPDLIYFKKNLNFRQESFMLIFGALTEVGVGIIASIITRNVWGMVASIVAGAIAEVIASYIVIPWPKISKPDYSEVKNLLKFGRWVWTSSVLSYIVNQGDDIFVGKFLGPTSLGFYQNAYKIASLPAVQITGTITQVVYPAFAAIQDDNVRLLRAFKKALFFTCLLTIPPCLLISVFALPFTEIVFGPNWLAMVPVLRILGIFGAIRAGFSLVGSLATALGRPELITYNGILRSIILFGLIYPLSQTYNIVGVAWSTTIAIIVAYIILYIQILRILHKPNSHVVKFS